MTGVGNVGYSWASTVSGTIAYHLIFGYNYVAPIDANYRTYGFQVRCLREWQPVGRKRNKGAALRAAPSSISAALRAAPRSVPAGLRAA